MDREKHIVWVGSSYEDLLCFPRKVIREAGFQLRNVQNGLLPDDWKPFGNVGAGVKEVRIRDGSGTYRVIYVAKFEEAIYVLHCFKKKSRATSKADKAVAATRYSTVINMRLEQ